MPNINNLTCMLLDWLLEETRVLTGAREGHTQVTLQSESLSSKHFFLGGNTEVMLEYTFIIAIYTTYESPQITGVSNTKWVPAVSTDPIMLYYVLLLQRSLIL